MSDKVGQLENQVANLEANPGADVREKIDVMNALAWHLRWIDLEQSVILCKTAYDLATSGSFIEANYKKGKAESLRILA